MSQSGIWRVIARIGEQSKGGATIIIMSHSIVHFLACGFYMREGNKICNCSNLFTWFKTHSTRRVNVLGGIHLAIFHSESQLRQGYKPF